MLVPSARARRVEFVGDVRRGSDLGVLDLRRVNFGRGFGVESSAAVASMEKLRDNDDGESGEVGLCLGDFML